MTGLSHGVIRVNTEDKNSALTVQDVGHVMPGGETGKEGDVFSNLTTEKTLKNKCILHECCYHGNSGITNCIVKS